MRFEIETWGIRIIPETPQDQAYIRDTLGATLDRPPGVRVEKVLGLREIAYLVVQKPKGGEVDDG